MRPRAGGKAATRGAAPASPVSPTHSSYLSGVSQQPLILTGNELRTLNMALISILRDLQIQVHLILRMSLSLSRSFLQPHLCLQV